MVTERYLPMEIELNSTKLKVLLGDIVDQDVDVVVNAANERLEGGSGVDWAIHSAAGWNQLQEACRKIDGCEEGEAVITPGFKLRARYIIHTVGPVYATGWINEDGKRHNEQAKILLANCYRNSLRLAYEYGARSIAFPAISTGMYQYPIEEATDIAVLTVKQWVLDNAGVFEEIRFVMHDDFDYTVGKERIAKHFLGSSWRTDEL